jgi:putative flavoprotein involved in K+ transport
MIGKCGRISRATPNWQSRLPELLDEWARTSGLAGTVDLADRPPPTRVEDEPPLGMDLVKSGIKTIVWASGYRPDYSWLKLPVLDRKATSPMTAASSPRPACT